MLREYLQFGGFPEVVLQEGATNKERLLKQYFEDLLYRDVVWRYRVRDIATLKNIALLCMTNIANPYSYNRIKNVLDVPLDVVRNYTTYMEETYLVRTVMKHSFKLKEQLRNPKKIYAVDTGLRNAVSYRFSEDLGRVAENVVYLSLVRQDKDIYYYKNRGEVDFLVRQGVRTSELMQVCMAGPEDEPAMKREILSLAEAMTSTKIPEGIIITDDRDEIIELQPGKIKCIPLWKWLLV